MSAFPAEWNRGRRTLVRFGLPLLLVIGYAVFYAAAWPEAPLLSRDSHDYLAIARDLEDGRLDELHRRPPGYPLILAAFGGGDRPGRGLLYAQLVAHLAALAALAGLLRRVGISSRVAGACVVLGALPPAVQPAALVLTETLTELLIVAGVVGFVVWARRGNVASLLLSAGAFAYSGLTRPTYQLAAPALALLLVAALSAYRPLRAVRRRLFVGSAVLVAGTVVLLGGFALRNRVVHGYFGVVPGAGFHLCNKTWAVLDRLPEPHREVREVLIAHRDRQVRENLSGWNYIWDAIPDLKRVTGLSEPALARHLERLNFELILRAPWHYVGEVAGSAVTYWMPLADDMSSFGSRALLGTWSALHFAVVGVFVFALARLFGGALLWRALDVTPAQRRAASGGADGAARLVLLILAGGLMAYTMGITIAFDVATARHRAPTDALMWASIALLSDGWSRMRRAARAS